jgi:rsbT antagonist protein RsbS
MANLLEGSKAAISIVQGCYVVSVQADLYDDLLVRIRKDILNRVYSKTVKGVVFDMSAVKVMDTYIFNHLVDIGKMTLLLGVKTIFIGFQPGAVSALLDLEVDTTNVMSYRTTEEAVEHLTATVSSIEDYDDDDGENELASENDELENDELEKDELERDVNGYTPNKRET